MKYTDLPSPEVTIIAEGDPNELSAAISFISWDRILKSGSKHSGNMLGLWMFYAITARRQNTNKPRATVKFVAKGMRWGIDKVREVRNELKALELIEDVQARGENGMVQQRYVKVNYLVSGKKSQGLTVLGHATTTVNNYYGKSRG